MSEGKNAYKRWYDKHREQGLLQVKLWLTPMEALTIRRQVEDMRLRAKLEAEKSEGGRGECTA